MLPILTQAKAALVQYAGTTQRPDGPSVSLPEVLDALPEMDARNRSKAARIRIEAKRGNTYYTKEEIAIITLIAETLSIGDSYPYLASMPLWSRVNNMGTAWRSPNFKRMADRRAEHGLRRNQSYIPHQPES